MNRVDFHVHVGKVYGSKNPDESAPVEGLVQYILNNKITHAGVCYINKRDIDELQSRLPDVKVYRYQWITSTDQEVDEDADGIKLHSHRGPREVGFTFGPNKGPVNTMDYTSRALDKFLARQRKNLIVQYHTQGSASVTNRSRPYAIGALACKHKHLKHIIVHAGSFGLMSYYPTTSLKPQTVAISMAQEIAVREAVLIANRLPNVYLDGSVFIAPAHYKTEMLLYHTRKVAFGSDWPYGLKTPYGEVLKAERMVTRFIGEDGVQGIHDRALYYLESDVDDLFENEAQGGVVNEHVDKNKDYLEIMVNSTKKKSKKEALLLMKEQFAANI